MPVRSTAFSQSETTSTGTATLVTCPSGHVYYVKSCILSERAGGTPTAQLFVEGGGAYTGITSGAALAAYEVRSAIGVPLILTESMSIILDLVTAGHVGWYVGGSDLLL